MELSIAEWITAVSTAVAKTINVSGPPLFGILALVGSFFFVWNRVRSLW